MREEDGLAAPPIERAPRDGGLRLSFAQERLWFLDQLEPGSAFYNVPSGLRIKGALDALALERALREIIRRHEVLRTTFASASGRPVQIVHESIDFTFPIDDVGPVPSAERDAVVLRHAEIEAARPFDLVQGPLLRARLVELDGDDHLLLLTLHHIVSDGWTRGLLNRELTTLYAAFVAGKPSPLPELTLQYADYAAWQRGWLSGRSSIGRSPTGRSSSRARRRSSICPPIARARRCSATAAGSGSPCSRRTSPGRSRISRGARA